MRIHRAARGGPLRATVLTAAAVLTPLSAALCLAAAPAFGVQPANPTWQSEIRPRGDRVDASAAGIALISAQTQERLAAGANSPAGPLLVLTFEGLRRGDAMVSAAGAAAFSGSTDRASRLHEAGVTEWLESRPGGVEHGFTIERRIVTGGEPTLGVRMRLETTLRVMQKGPGTILFFPSAPPPGIPAAFSAVARYSNLLVRDSLGAEVSARFEVGPGHIDIVLDDREAVYPLTVDPILTTAAWTQQSDQNNAQMGRSVAPAGDVNGDGFSDVIVGTWLWDNGQSNEGKASIYCGSASGLIPAPCWSVESNQTDAQFGGSVSSAGDVNGDGYDDVLVGANWWTNGQSKEGGAWVYLGGPAGPSTTAAWHTEGNQADSNFGRIVAWAGDVNNDGFSDVLVGAKDYDNGQTDEGRAYLYLGSASGLSTTPAWTAEPNQAGASFGISVATAGDVNGDGYADVIVGANLFDGGPADQGAAFVYSGGPSGLSASPIWTGMSGQAGANYGFSVATAGDTNGDGYADILIGGYQYDVGAFTDEGRAYVYFGSAAGPTASPSWIAHPRQSGASFGSSVATTGDVNGDGYADIVVGAYLYDLTQADEGAAFAYFGSTTGPALNPSWTGAPAQPGASYGWSVSTAGDVDGDGFGDLVVGAYKLDSGQPDEGAVLTYEGGGDGLSLTPAWTITGPGFDFAAISVGSAGDVNGDGYDELVVGYPFAANYLGRAELYLGSAAGLSLTPSWAIDATLGPSGISEYGYGVSGAGDVNGDGYADVVVTSNEERRPPYNEGLMYLYCGSPSGLSTAPCWTGYSGRTESYQGTDLRDADFNADGYSDLAVGFRSFDGDPQDGDANPIGAFFVYLGGPGGYTPTPIKVYGGYCISCRFGVMGPLGDINDDGYADVMTGSEVGTSAVPLFYGVPDGVEHTETTKFTAAPGDSAFGIGVSTGGDVNGDGIADALIGSTGTNPTAHLYVRFGSPAGLPAAPNQIVFTQAAGGAGLYGSGLDSSGDFNGDGFADTIVTAPLELDGSGSKGRAYVYLGSSAGLPSGADWSYGDTTGATTRMEASGSAGDINGDGFSDAFIVEQIPGNQQRVLVFMGGAGGGLTRIPRQLQTPAGPPIPPGGRSGSATGYSLDLLARSSAGRSKFRLLVESKPVAMPLNNTALSLLATGETGAPGPAGSAAPASGSVGSQTAVTRIHWRARLAAPNPLHPYSPWIALSRNGSATPRLRTAGCLDLDGDGYFAPHDPLCGSPDCLDMDPAVWAQPGEVPNVVFSPDEVTVSWSPPAYTGGAGSLRYDTILAPSFLRLPDWMPDYAPYMIEEDGVDLQSTIPSKPTTGYSYFVLVRAKNACPSIGGTWGYRTSGDERYYPTTK